MPCDSLAVLGVRLSADVAAALLSTEDAVSGLRAYLSGVLSEDVTVSSTETARPGFSTRKDVRQIDGKYRSVTFYARNAGIAVTLTAGRDLAIRSDIRSSDRLRAADVQAKLADFAPRFATTVTVANSIERIKAKHPQRAPEVRTANGTRVLRLTI